MCHHPAFMEIDCRSQTPPKEGQIFTMSILRQEQFEVITVVQYQTPVRRPDGTTATHQIRYRPKPK